MIYDVHGNPLVTESELTDAGKALGVHLMPTTLGELNMVKRARQFTDIKWTPTVNLKRRNAVEYDAESSATLGWEDTFLADTEYKGIPYSHGYYSGANRNFGMVGFEVSIDAFATSVQFASSYMCATDHWSVANAVYTNYGASCDTLVCYAMGLSTWYGSDSGFQTLVNNGTITSVCSGDAISDNIANIHLGDILWKRAVHVAIITDVVTDDNGNIFIEVCEATTKGGTNPIDIGLQMGGVCRRELWSLDEDFYTRFYGYTVYRYVNSENVPYTQSKFVTLEGESPLHNLGFNMPLIPYMGDSFAYLSNSIPNTNILIKATSFENLAVYKDGTLFNIFAVNSATSIDTGFSAVGEYEAFLFNGTLANITARTVSTKWSVI